MYELAKEPADIGRVIDGGIKLFTASFKSVILLALVATFIVYIPELVVRLFVDSIDESQVPLMALLFIFLSLLLVLVYLSLYTALILKIWSCARQESLEIKALVEKGFALLLPVVLASILYCLGIFIGILLLIIPGIYLTVAFCLYYFAVVIEERGPIEALKRSFNLTRGNWWRTFLILLIPTMIVMVLFTVVGFAAGILAFFLAGFTAEGAVFEIIVEVFLNIAQAVSMPFFVSLLLVLYHDLAIRQSQAATETPQLEDPVVRR